MLSQRGLRLWRYLLLASFILLSQGITLAHASEHEFHHSDEVCFSFDFLEHQQGSALNGSVSHTPVVPAAGLRNCALTDKFSVPVQLHHSARGPPSLLI
jgi:hypothetical protein